MPYACFSKVTFDDAIFDLQYPPSIQGLSSLHWTPVNIARYAARLLVTAPGTRVLDIGCGPGKFCVIGAMTTEGHFTGIEQREHLAAIARRMVLKNQLSNVEIIHGNMMEIDFSKYDAFYLYNPFEENTVLFGKIDTSVELSTRLYARYTEYVATQLALAPAGTRVVTYCGAANEVPQGYSLQQFPRFSGLRLWTKTE